MNYQKYQEAAVPNIIKHAERTLKNNSNKDIDMQRTNLNYTFELDHQGLSTLDYFRYRKSQLFKYNRDDVKVMCSWIITTPVDLPPNKEYEFFEACKDFLIDRYGNRPEDWIGFYVHKDELGSDSRHTDTPTAHMHAYFIPTVEDKKHDDFEYKICANEAVTRADMRSIHLDLDMYLKQKGLSCSVLNNATETLGRNHDVKELKQGKASYDKLEMTKAHQHENRWNRSQSDGRDNYSRW